MNNKLKGCFGIARKKIRILLLFFLLYAIVFWFIIPKTINIEDNFEVYNYLDEPRTTRNLDFKITITNHRKLFSYKNSRVLLQIGDRIYRYDSLSYKGSSMSNIVLRGMPFNFGVLLPNKDFSEFVLLFDEKNHHFDETEELEFIAYPKRNEEESRQLLEELIEYNKYDVNSRY